MVLMETLRRKKLYKRKIQISDIWRMQAAKKKIKKGELAISIKRGFV